MFVYVGNAGSQDITVLELALDGGVRPVHTIALPERPRAAGSLALAMSPDQRFLFAAVREPPYAAVTYAIDATTGMLSYLGSGELAASMVYLSTDRTGRFLLSASYHQDVVAVNPIGADGVIGSTRQRVATLRHPHSVLVAPSNRFAFHACLGADVVHQHRFDPTSGTLSPNAPPTVSVRSKAGPRHFVFSPSGRFVYLLDELDGSIDVFPLDAETGTLQPQIQSATSLPAGFAGTPWAADIHVTPDGQFLYTSERTSSTLAAFRIDRDRGTLTALGSVPTATQPRAFAIDPSGRYLLAVGQRSNTMMRYAINESTGALRPLDEHPVGANPTWVEVR